MLTVCNLLCTKNNMAHTRKLCCEYGDDTQFADNYGT